jgi:hypothetical protein
MDSSSAAARASESSLPSIFAGRKQALTVLGAVLALGWSLTPATAASVFTSGPFTLPEGITMAPDGGYLLSDADNQAVYEIPATGGPPTSSTAMNFRVFGEIALPSGYAQSGQYLAYGTDSTNSFGVAALVGTSGLSAPTTVVNIANGWFGDAVVAPSKFGTIAAGAVVLSDENPGTPLSSIVTLNASEKGVSTFTTLPTGVVAFGIGFAPASFGADAGDLFVSDASSGKLFVTNAAGNSTLFATLPLPTGFIDPGLRQIAWAPSDFGKYGGDLFVSIAAQNGGGGEDGEIDILNAAGKTVGHYFEGTGATPLDPRGLFFVNDTTLLVANADPGIQLLTPNDFVAGVPGGVPEPSTWAMMLLGFAGLGFVGYRRAMLGGRSWATRRVYERSRIA